MNFDRDALRAAAGQCACANFRKAARAVTQYFDEMLQPIGLRSTQLIIVLVVAAEQPTNITQLAEALVMDRSTLTRNLRPLEKLGLISVNNDRGRTRLVTLTTEGEKKLAEAIPFWKKAQGQFVDQLGPRQWDALVDQLSATVTIARGDS
ncbi:MarR family protein [Planctomycetes bacterium Pan216]|uniref:MarR family protein n=1 Tax=Kolteria novifilia TaxID=2527975 RepID=A0A518BBJ0_9BACT|nr:MarR family protein [Planctomycetes bacterium Pan216]